MVEKRREETSIRERTVEAFFVRHIHRLGGEVRKVKWIGRRGAPDRLVLFLNRPGAWVELKRPGGIVEPHQQREHERLRRMGQTVLVLSSYDEITRAFPE